MGEITDLAQLINTVETSRTNFENRIRNIRKEDFLIDGIWGKWNLKDLIAHTIAWENEMIIWINQVIRTQNIPVYLQPGFSDEDVDEFNYNIYLKNKDKDLQEILSEFYSNRQKVLDFIKAQDEETLFSQKLFNLRDNWSLMYVIGANTFWHYDEHLTDLNNLEKKED